MGGGGLRGPVCPAPSARAGRSPCGEGGSLRAAAMRGVWLSAPQSERGKILPDAGPRAARARGSWPVCPGPTARARGGRGQALPGAPCAATRLLWSMPTCVPAPSVTLYRAQAGTSSRWPLPGSLCPQAWPPSERRPWLPGGQWCVCWPGTPPPPSPHTGWLWEAGVPAGAALPLPGASARGPEAEASELAADRPASWAAGTGSSGQSSVAGAGRGRRPDAGRPLTASRPGHGPAATPSPALGPPQRVARPGSARGHAV